MKRQPAQNAFTLVEMLVVMAIIAILTGIILSVNGLVQTTAARNRATAEIKSLSAACEAYKADTGSYPQSSSYTDVLDPNPASAKGNFQPNPTFYNMASQFLWQQLSGHLQDLDSTLVPTGTNYAGDFFKASVLNGTKNTMGQITAVNYILDPFGNPYGYSTAGLLADQNYRAAVLQNQTGVTRAVAGFNPTFDLWSTGGSTTATTSGTTGATSTPKWVKNW